MTDRYAVIGNPVLHSKSPFIHSGFAAAAQQDMSYVAIQAPLDGFNAVAQKFCAEGGKGLNITAPFKLDAFELATEHSERAQRAGAANALKFEGSRILAENFDGIGLANDIERNLGVAIAGKRVLLLGAGGAARGLLGPFLERKPAALVIVNRTFEKAQALVQAFDEYRTLSACAVNELGAQRFDIVLNATSAGLRTELPAISSTAFAPDALAYELVYGKGLTPFLQFAREAGVQRLADGTGMLVEQAAEAFYWWRGVRPGTKAMIAKLAKPLMA